MLAAIFWTVWGTVFLVAIICGLAETSERNRKRERTIELQAREIERLRKVAR